MSALTEPKSLGELLISARDAFDRAGITNPIVNAERMLEDLLNLSRAELYLNRNLGLSEAQLAQMHEWAKARRSGKPLQYLLGHSGFFGLDLKVEEGVFIPRPETEKLVEMVLGEVGMRENSTLNFLDIGTGSGAIAVALAVNLPQASGVAVDFSEFALDLARRNAERYGVQSRLRFEKADLFPSSGETFDLVVSNPPYIPYQEIQNLALEVKGFEPLAALDGGENGMRFHRAILARADAFLRPGGLLGFEIGWDQGQTVAGMMREAGYEQVVIEKDFAGLDRVVMGHWPIRMN